MKDQSHVNLLNLIKRDTDLKRTASTQGGEYHGPCPFCGGTDRFIVQPNAKSYPRWSCRQCSPRWGDAIQYVQRRDDLSFPEACEVLRIPLDELKPRVSKPKMPYIPNGSDKIALTDSAWQQSARQFIRTSVNHLFKSGGQSAHHYLIERGITEDTMILAGLGYNPETYHTMWGETKVWLPEGIVIPWLFDETIYRVNIRRLTQGADPKYVQPKGGANGLYGADALCMDCIAVMVEGEFDALVLQNEAAETLAKHQAVVVATGSVSGARLLRWRTLLGMTRGVIAAFDADQAGDQAFEYWRTHLSKPVVRHTPTFHDITGMSYAAERLNVWLEEAIEALSLLTVKQPK